MRARGWVVVVLGLWVATAAAEPKPTPVDIKPFKSKLQVFQDGAGGTYVVLDELGASEARVWYGTGKLLYEQAVTGRSWDGDHWSVNTWAPRLSDMHPAYLMYKDDGTYVRMCDGRDDAILSKLSPDKATAVLDKYKLMTIANVYVPHLLARDDGGIYYYVDRLRERYGSKGFRVFVGKKGAMKQLALVDIASDSMGQVFSTKTGDLRLVNTTDESSKGTTTWVRGEKRTTLLKLDVDVNSPVIFNDLGVYKFTGTLCDNI
jgi:hypothetical protein